MSTVVFTDIEGSTTLVRELGEAYEPLLEEHFELLRGAFSSAGGWLVSSEGDGMLVVFERAGEAAAACVDAQLRLKAAGLARRGLRVRMGLHSGPVQPRADGADIWGLTVHQAARVTATGHGGQIVCSSAAAALIDALPLRDLGRFGVRDFDRPERMFEVVVPGNPASFPQLRARPAEGHNLAPPRNSFVGRDQEMSRLSELLAGQRLITLMGPGGCGKTRLAEEITRRHANDFADGAVFVRLAGVEDPSLAVPRLAESLGVREEPGRPLLTTLVAALAHRAALVVLDNCEQVVAGLRPVLGAILDGAPDIVMLTTSRVSLNLSGESVVAVDPLSVPGPETPAELVATSDAAQLLIDRAVSAGARFEVDEHTTPHLIALCRMLDGLPLALELAAARLRSLSPKALAERLGSTVAGLGSTEPGGDRHGTVVAMVEWSLRFLDDDALRLCRRLSVFRGGFDLDAAEEVGGLAPLTSSRVLRLLDSLVAQSLIAFDPHGDGRYRQLTVVRDVVAPGLVASGEAQAVQTQHFQHFQHFIEACAADLSGRPTARLQAEADNIQAALAFGMGRESTRQTAAELAVSLTRSWVHSGVAAQGLAVVEPLADLVEGQTLGRVLYALGALRQATDPPSGVEPLLRAQRLLDAAGDEDFGSRVMGALGAAAMLQGDFEAARPQFEAALHAADDDRHLQATWMLQLGILEHHQARDDKAESLALQALERARELGDGHHLAASMRLLGQIAFSQGKLDDSDTWLRRALAEAEAAGDRMSRAAILGNLGNVAHRRKDDYTAEAMFQSAAAESKAIGNRAGLAQWVSNLGVLAFGRGQLPEAARCYEQAVAAARAIGDAETIALAGGNLGQVRAMLGDTAGAESAFTEALELARRSGARARVAASLGNLANLALMSGRVDEAEAYLREAIEIARAAGLTRNEGVYSRYLAQCAIERKDWAAAIQCAERARECSEAAEDIRWQITILQTLCTARRGLGDLEAATADAKAALDLVERHSDVTQLAACHATLAVLARDRSVGEDVVRHVEVALDSVSTATDAPSVMLRLASVTDPIVGVRLAAAAASWLQRAGRPLTGDALAGLDSWMHETQLELGQAAFDEQWAAGEQLSLEDAAAWARDRITTQADRS